MNILKKVAIAVITVLSINIFTTIMFAIETDDIISTFKQEISSETTTTEQAEETVLNKNKDQDL